MFYHGFFLFSSFFFRRLIPELAEPNSTKIGHVVGSNCNLKMHVRNLDCPFPLQIGGSKTTFWARNLRTTLTAYIFGMKRDIDNRPNALTTTRGLLHRPKMSWTLAHKRLKSRPAFLPTPVNSAFCFIARLRQTKISKRNSTTLCQTVDGK